MGRDSLLVVALGVGLGYALLRPKTTTESKTGTDPLLFPKYSVGDIVNTDKGRGRIVAWTRDPAPDIVYSIEVFKLAEIHSSQGVDPIIQRAEGEISLFVDKPLPTGTPPPNYFTIGDRVHSTLGEDFFVGTIMGQELKTNFTVTGYIHPYMWIYLVQLDTGGNRFFPEINLVLKTVNPIDESLVIIDSDFLAQTQFSTTATSITSTKAREIMKTRELDAGEVISLALQNKIPVFEGGYTVSQLRSMLGLTLEAEDA